jgi:hypothetical protein
MKNAVPDPASTACLHLVTECTLNVVDCYISTDAIGLCFTFVPWPNGRCRCNRTRKELSIVVVDARAKGTRLESNYTLGASSEEHRPACSEQAEDAGLCSAKKSILPFFLSQGYAIGKTAKTRMLTRAAFPTPRAGGETCDRDSFTEPEL